MLVVSDVPCVSFCLPTAALVDGAERASNLVFKAESPYELGEEVRNILAEVVRKKLGTALVLTCSSPTSGTFEDTAAARSATQLAEGSFSLVVG